MRDCSSNLCSPEVQLALYANMARIRAVEECIAQAYPKQQMRCPIHLCIGQEAIAAGSCHALQQEDVVLSAHRSHGVYLAKEGDIVKFFKELHGKAGGATEGRGGSMHLAAHEVGFWGAVPILASSIAIATGVALAFQMRQESRVCMVMFGDGATEEGTFHESLQYAALKQLPIVYVCENNGFSVNTPLHERRAPQASLIGMAREHGIVCSSGDGNAVLDVYCQTKQAVERARHGEGPSFLEFTTYRWVEHCGYADDHHLPARSVAEGEVWKNRCPLQQLENTLIQAGLCSPDALRTLRIELEVQARTALAEAERACWPDPTIAHTKVYADA